MRERQQRVPSLQFDFVNAAKLLMTIAAKNGNESAPRGTLGVPPTFFCKSIIPGILIPAVLQGYHSKRLSADPFPMAFFRQRADSKVSSVASPRSLVVTTRHYLARVSFQGRYSYCCARVSL